VLEHKSGNISETRKVTMETYGKPIGTHPRSFERYYPPEDIGSVSNQNCCKGFRFTEKVEKH